jgi:LacI family gluconate utilization system Gnt-I transcriptional repressor
MVSKTRIRGSSEAHGSWKTSWICQYPEVDAAMCVSDLVALGAIMECHRRGWSVPGRISIAGFGNAELSEVCNPGITTVAVDVRGMGLEIGRVLLEALEAVKHGETNVSTTQMVDYRIVERGSPRRPA